MDLNEVLWPKLSHSLQKDPAIEQKIDALLKRMSVEEKVGQMIQPEIRHLTPADVKAYHIGSVLNGGGSVPNNNRYAKAADWLAIADAYYRASMDESDGFPAIPLMWGTDAVHGVGNIVGATLFPHNIALGAANNPDLIEKIGQATAVEIAATGLDWDFSPTVAVVRDDRWGRTYESYSEHPDLVYQYARRMVDGLQGGSTADDFLSATRVIATAKHFIADGGTLNGIDRGDSVISEEDLRDIHGAGYFSAIEAGVQTVMASFSSWNGENMHGHKYLLTDVLKDKLGFDGLVVGDWNGHGFISGCSITDCPTAINAGLDIFMVPSPDWKLLFHSTVAHINSGVISAERADDAVRRILRVKFRAGLWEKGLPSSRPLAGRDDLLGCDAHRAIARQAVRESVVLLKNKNGTLPLRPDMNVLVAGDGANNISKQTGGWSISWQGIGNTIEDFPGATTLWSGIESTVKAAGGIAHLSPEGTYSSRPDVAIVIFGEDPYAEMQGDLQNLLLNAGDNKSLALMRKLKADNIPVVALFITGRPLWINRELNACDAFAVVWLPGTEGAAIADVIFRRIDGGVNHDTTGRLTFSWPKHPEQVPQNRGAEAYDPLFPYGFGLGYSDRDELHDDLSERGIKQNVTGSVLELFKRRPLNPYVITVEGKNNDRVVMNANVASVSSLTVSVIDRDVQEDARRVQWNGKGEGLVAISTTSRQILSDYLDSGAALVFDVKIDVAPQGKAKVRIGCGPSCYTEVELTEQFRLMAGQGWKTLKVDLRLFPDSSTDFGLKRTQSELFKLVLDPFVLVADDKLDLVFANVYLQKNAGLHKSICFV